MAIRRVTSIELDGTTVTFTIGRTEIPLLSVSYSDNLEQEFVAQMGVQVPVAQTPGVYKPGDGKLKIRGSVARSLLFPALPKKGAGNIITTAVCNFTHPDIGSDSDLLEGFRLLGNSLSLEASAKAQECEFTFKYRMIKWGSARICFGNTTGTGAVGAFRL